MDTSKKNSVIRLNYCQYLLSSQTNYTLTNYAEHVEELSHDMVNRYLRDEKLTPQLVWENVREDIVMDDSGYVVFDDSIIDKTHSKKIESVRWQYSGNAHGVIRGIGLVNCIYINPKTKQFWVIDYRIFDPERDGKSKVEHFKEMLNSVYYQKKLPYKTVLMDSWYASNKLMLFVNNLGKLFYCPIKNNRLAKHGETDEYYTKLTKLEWSEKELKSGKLIRFKRYAQRICDENVSSSCFYLQNRSRGHE